MLTPRNQREYIEHLQRCYDIILSILLASEVETDSQPGDNNVNPSKLILTFHSTKNERGEWYGGNTKASHLYWLIDGLFEDERAYLGLNSLKDRKLLKETTADVTIDKRDIEKRKAEGK